ncbi:hypothetical protein KI387_001211, partial [Taxus chinensis]
VLMFLSVITLFLSPLFQAFSAQDTLKTKPPKNKTMKKASLLVVTATTFFYMLCSFFGYAAFGENTPGNLLTGFGFYEPYWLVDFANACIVVHLVGAYQNKVQQWSINWVLSQTFSFICLLISLACVVGSMEGLVK